MAGDRLHLSTLKAMAKGNVSRVGIFSREETRIRRWWNGVAVTLAVIGYIPHFLVQINFGFGAPGAYQAYVGVWGLGDRSLNHLNLFLYPFLSLIGPYRRFFLRKRMNEEIGVSRNKKMRPLTN